MTHNPFGLELRERAGGLQLDGTAVAYDVSYNVGTFEETFRAGAFKRTLNDRPDVVLLVNHQGLPLARTTSGTLELREDTRGLHVSAALDADNPEVKALRPAIARGDVHEMSVAFSVMGRDGQAWSEDFARREILAANIHKGDVSIVTMAANPATSVTMRGHELSIETRRRCAEEIGGRITGARPVLGGIREVRAKYDPEELEKLGSEGKAYQNPDGHWSYPINDLEDLRNAIRAVGRGGAGHDAIRRYIMKRARAMDKTALIPETWNTDGSLSRSYYGPTSGCERCEGRGTVVVACPVCGGTGEPDEDDIYDKGGQRPDGLHEPPVVGVEGAPRAFTPIDLTVAMAEVNAARERVDSADWEREVRDSHHRLEVERLEDRERFRRRLRRERMIRQGLR